jgi:Ca2+-binding RTX toxin-like protein
VLVYAIPKFRAENCFLLSKITMNLLTDVLLRQGLAQATAILHQFAGQAKFLEQLRTAFGENFDENVGLGIGSQFQAGDFRLLPDIQVLSRGELGTANGAYAGDLDKIFVSADFLAQHQGDVNAVSELLLEEIELMPDRLLNGNVDSPGDEGAIFRLLVTGQTIAASTLAGLKRQDDHTVITVNGQAVAIEKQDFTGTGGNDTIVATAGDDVINPGLGHDTVDGGAGNDTLVVDYSANANDGYYGYHQGITTSLANGAGNITAYSRNGGYDQVAFTGIENFNITGTQYNDNLIGSAGNDIINGGAGDDTVISNGGVDILDGGTGTDYAVGVDVSSSSGNNNFSLLDPTHNNLANSSKVINFEQISLTTGAGNDTIVGGNLSDTFSTGAGDDIINPGLGHDTVDGGAGNDTLIVDYSANANDGYYGYHQGITTSLANGAGNITAYSRSGAYDQVAFTGIENFNITGTQYNDNLIGGTGNDTLLGGAGDDSVTSNGGVDILDGGDGTDFAVVDVSSSSGNNNFALLDSTRSSLTNGSKVINFEQISLTTGAGNDTISGGNLSDTFSTGAGDDTISVGLGHDNVDGGADNDTLIVDYSANANDGYYGFHRPPAKVSHDRLFRS